MENLINKSNISGDFTMIPNRIIDTPLLSGKSKAYLIYMLRRPKDWKIRVVDMEKHFKEGARAIRSGIHELIEQGYVKRVPQREAGRIIEWSLYVYDTPQVKTDKSAFPPDVRFADVEIVDVQIADVQNSTLLIQSNTNTDSTNTEVTKNNTDFKKSSSYGEQEKELLKYINQRLGRNYRQEKKFQANLKARLKSGYTIAQIKGAFDRAVDDDFHRKNNYKHLSPEFICRSDKLEKFLNAPVEAKKKGAKFIKVANV